MRFAKYAPVLSVLVLASVAALHVVLVPSGLVPAFETGSVNLFDPDSCTRLLRVAQLHATGRWYDPTLAAINAPFGLELHWTRPLDVLLLAGVATGLEIWVSPKCLLLLPVPLMTLALPWVRTGGDAPRVAMGALLFVLPGLPADAKSLECAGNDYIFGRNVVSRTLTLRMDEKTLVQEPDGRPCDRRAAAPTTGRPTAPAIAMFKGLCHET